MISSGKLGFTGTQNGMTKHQKDMFSAIVDLWGPVEFHHGDCVGSDKQAHDLVRETIWEWNRRKINIVIHPPDNDSKRAFCRGDESREVKPYLERNKDIVDECDTIVATPKETKEELRSGTWATIRQAKKAGKELIILFPDGGVKYYDGKDGMV